MMVRRKKSALFLLSGLLLFLILTSFLTAYSSNQRDDLDEFKKELSQEIHSGNPREATLTIRQLMQKDKMVMENCHEIMHYVGEEAYKKYKDFGKAIEFEDIMCTSGYIHGLIEAYITETGTEYKNIDNICSNYPPHSFRALQCYHAIGHGIMYYSGNDLLYSLSECDKLKSEFERETCSGGTYMEYFNSDPILHPTKLTNNPFSVCSEAKEHKNQCYVNISGFFLKNNDFNYNSAIDSCQEAEEEYIGICIAGVIAYAVNRNIDNPKLSENLCNKVDAKHKEACVKELTIAYVSYFSSAKKGKELCSTLRDENKSYCNEVVNNYDF